MKRFVTAVLLAFVAAAASAAPPAVAVKTLATPVRSARLWTTAVSPNPRGGWNFIAQFWNYGSKENAEWIIVDLEKGASHTVLLPGYANALYDYTSQVRAGNGRIFFSVSGCTIDYYEPAEETVKTLGAVVPRKSGGDSFFYRISIGPDGMAYATSQSSNGYTSLVQVNPDTLKVKVFDKLGSGKRKIGLTYGYHFCADPPWVYVAVGQGEWDLVAVNVDSGEKRLLAERHMEGAMISFNNRVEGIRATLRSPLKPGEIDLGGQKSRMEGHILYTPDAKAEYFWCVDGKLVPAPFRYQADTLPFTPLNRKTYAPFDWQQTKPMPLTAKPPEFDLNSLALEPDGQARLPWRPAGEQTWKTVSFTVKNTEPIELESLVALPDGSLFGNARQYSGFFRYTPADGKSQFFPRGNVSRPVHAVMDGKDYYCGYPNSHLYVYDPAKPWDVAGKRDADPEANPHVLGNFGQYAGAHYAYYLIPADNGRLYFGGRRERRDTGAGIGYCEPATGKFHGLLHVMQDIKPRGMAVLEDIGRVVVSGEIDNPKDAAAMKAGTPLRVFDLDLKEIETLTVKPGLTNTGSLYPGAKPAQVVGWIDSRDVKAVYLFDLNAKKLLQWKEFDTSIGDLFRRAGEAGYWCQQPGGLLLRFDPATLTATAVAKLDRNIGRPQWVGNILYGIVGPELVAATINLKP